MNDVAKRAKWRKSERECVARVGYFLKYRDYLNAATEVVRAERYRTAWDEVDFRIREKRTEKENRRVARLRREADSK